MVADLCHLALSRCRQRDNATSRQRANATSRQRDNATTRHHANATSRHRCQGWPLSIFGSKGQGHRTWITETDFRTVAAFPFHLSSWNLVHKLSMSQGWPLLILGSEGRRTWITENDFRTTSALPFHLSSWDLVHKLPISQQWPLLGLWSKVKVTRYR